MTIASHKNKKKKHGCKNYPDKLEEYKYFAKFPDGEKNLKCAKKIFGFWLSHTFALFTRIFIFIFFFSDNFFDLYTLWLPFSAPIHSNSPQIKRTKTDQIKRNFTVERKPFIFERRILHFIFPFW